MTKARSSNKHKVCTLGVLKAFKESATYEEGIVLTCMRKTDRKPIFRKKEKTAGFISLGSARKITREARKTVQNTIKPKTHEFPRIQMNE